MSTSYEYSITWESPPDRHRYSMSSRVSGTLALSSRITSRHKSSATVIDIEPSFLKNHRRLKRFQTLKKRSAFIERCEDEIEELKAAQQIDLFPEPGPTQGLPEVIDFSFEEGPSQRVDKCRLPIHELRLADHHSKPVQPSLSQLQDNSEISEEQPELPAAKQKAYADL